MPTGKVIAARFKALMHSKKGAEAVSFLMTTGMLIFVCVTLISSMVYIVQYYNVNYICRRVVRSIEATGQYDEQAVSHITEEMRGEDLVDVRVQVDAPYFDGRKIQLRDTFRVTLTASYRITIMTFGGEPVSVALPIKSRVAGMSEVFWK